MRFLTKNIKWEMRVDYQKNDKTWSYLHYNQFSVGSASEEYPLTVGGLHGVGTDYCASVASRYISNKMNLLLRIMIMIYTVMITVQHYIRVDGGIISVTTLTSTDNHLRYVTMYSSSEMKIHPKDCIIQ